MAPKKSRNTEELPKCTKSTDRRARHRCRFGLPLGRSLDYWRRLEPYWPWNYCRCPFLVLLKHFAVLVLLCLQILAKKKNSLKGTKHEKIYSLATTKHNSINALVSKSLNDNVVTDRKFQIINSELEKYFECVPMSN